MHDVSYCCFIVKMPCLSSFFSDLYSNVVILVKIASLYAICHPCMELCCCGGGLGLCKVHSAIT